jgi:CDP-paratose 2-epimerase
MKETIPLMSRPVLITGGSGFIGTNLAHRILQSGRTVFIFDNLSRPGVEENLIWLRRQHGDRLYVEIADVRNSRALQKAVGQASQVFHFAAQVAVTASLLNPIHDFNVNAIGTLNLLEALRLAKDPPPLVYTSTNKVYGALPDIELKEKKTRYEPVDSTVRANGVAESRPLDFHSPYGCSKGTADQYVIDYAPTFSIPAVVFRMSCIYGPHQFGNEDQGWVAHFLMKALKGEAIDIYGDGKQVRDVLYIEDLVDAFLLAQEQMDSIAGNAFNIGGGPDNTLSLIELIDQIGRMTGRKPEIRFDQWRVGDQRYYVSDIGKFRQKTGWNLRRTISQGLQQLYGWLRDQPDTSFSRGSEDYEIFASES